MPACERSNLTTWHEKHFTVRDRAGIQERRKRAEHAVQEALKGAKPGNWGCVQVREGWSTEELPHYRPGHFWIFEFGEASQGSSVEKEFHLQGRRSEVYKAGLRRVGGLPLRFTLSVADDNKFRALCE